MTQSEIFALSHTLSDYPDDETYAAVQLLIRNDHESVTVWEMMEDWAITDLIDYQDELEKGVREILI
jgi:hypothetical protein